MDLKDNAKKKFIDLFKETMSYKKFEKVTVTELCKSVGVNRKTFYYYFKDKEDLVCEIFRSEFVENIKEEYENGLYFMADILSYLQENRKFYSWVLKDDKNLFFIDFIKGATKSFLIHYFEGAFAVSDNGKFYAEFYAEAFFAIIKKWLLEYPQVSPEKFVLLFENSFKGFSQEIVNIKYIPRNR